MDRVKVYVEICELLREKAKAAHIVDLEKYYLPIQGKSPYYCLASSLQNGTSSGMDRSIKFNGENNAAITRLLKDFDFLSIANEYPDWKALYCDFVKAIPDSGDAARQQRADKKKNPAEQQKVLSRKTNWEKYVRGLWEGAKFLSENQGLLDKLIEHEDKGEFDRANIKKSLEKIQKGIRGLGFALTCDWLKECGCTWLAKPDVHIKKVYAAMVSKERGVQIDESKIKELDVIEYYYDWARELQNNGYNVSAYQIDKMIWLICTGDFYLDKNTDIGRDTILKAILA